MYQILGLHLVLVVTVLATGEETRSRGKVPGPPQDGAVVPDLHKGLDDCKKVKKGCFGCSLSGQLWEAAWRGNLSEVNTAIAAGANPLCQNPNRLRDNSKGYYIHETTAIHAAARANHAGVVTALLDVGVDVNLQTTVGVTPTYDATWTGSIDALNVLIDHNADVNIPRYNGYTPLMLAASQGHLSTAKALINANASLDVVGVGLGGTALYYAASIDNPDVALLLIEHNANVNLRNPDGMTPLMAASRAGQLSTAKALISVNASIDVTAEGWWGGTALHYAINNNNPDVALLLIEHNAYINLLDSDGLTPLMAASRAGQLSAAKALVNANASLDVTGGLWAGTALGYAAMNNKQDIALLVLQSGADASITDRYGNTPAAEARSRGHNQLAYLIESYTTTGGTTDA